MMEQDEDFVIGADLSLLKRNLDNGVEYRSGGAVVDPVAHLRDCGFSWARLRLFNAPTGHGAQCTDLPYTLELGRQLKAAGYKLLLDLHYSDTWADPAKQYTPKAWLGLGCADLEQRVYDYTVEVANAFARHGARPDGVQVGNEITAGMLWPVGKIAEGHDTNTVHWQQDPSSNDADAWLRFGRLLKAGIRGVHDALGRGMEVMIHIDRGGDIPTNRWFFDGLLEQDVAFDAIGESYYPFWHGMPEDLGETLEFLAERYGKDLYVAEAAYPYMHDAFYENALSGDQAGWERLTGKYPLTPDGQARFMEDVTAIARGASRGRGLYYWAPEWIPVPDPAFEDEADAPPCWARALFDARGDALPALDVFGRREATVPQA